MKTKLFPSLLAAIALPLASQGAPINLNDVLSQWNVVTYQDLKSVNDIEGRAYVGGNVTIGNSFQPGNSSRLFANDISLAVAGNIVGGNPINVNRGSIVVGGTTSGRTFNMNSGGTVTAGSSWAANNSPLSVISQGSTYLSTLAANGTISVNSANAVTFNAPANASVAIFDVTDTATFERANLQGFYLNASAGTTIVINVNATDGTVDWKQGNFFDLFQQADWKGHVLFNFYNATTIKLHDQFDGYVLAPLADVTEQNNIDGGVIARNLTVGSEVHLPDENSSASAWYGNVPITPVPEPGVVSLLLGGVAVLMGSRRFLRR